MMERVAEMKGTLNTQMLLSKAFTLEDTLSYRWVSAQTH